jgi:hypothetical protein
MIARGTIFTMIRIVIMAVIFWKPCRKGHETYISTGFPVSARRKRIHVTQFAVPKPISDIGRISVILTIQYLIFIFIINTEENNSLYFLKNIFRLTSSRMIAYAMHVVNTREIINAYKILDGKYEGMTTLGRNRNNFRLILKNRVQRCDRISLIHSRGQWRALINTVTKSLSSIYTLKFLAK